MKANVKEKVSLIETQDGANGCWNGTAYSWTSPVQTNPYYSYSSEKTVINALRRLKLKLTQGPVKQKINDAVMEMFDQLVTADIPSMEPSSQVKTSLLHHQKQVFWFMTQKEKPRAFGPKEEDNNSLWRIEIQSNGSKRYKDIISRSSVAFWPT
ncbi:SNF2 family N-terminal domain-containing protein [Penicillium canescens]|nr:SNF2 family N-terminal domain-containing protein [Penicillium canescens]KAJ6097582.1 SNF2 family N-terminal domain-containing protein [Penicillium canescens]